MPSTANTTVISGLDRIRMGEIAGFRGRPVTLLCHPASVDRRLVHARQVIEAAGGRIVSLMGPEHGIDATAQDMAAVGDDGGDATTPVYSLYGKTSESLRPTSDMFHDADLLICDLQDVGTRYYTYVWTIVLACEVALTSGRTVWVLDRPNPLGGGEGDVEGGTIDPGYESFVGLHPIATRHGLTVGELVTLALRERGMELGDRFEVIRCVGWHRDSDFSATGLPWVMPSPNMPTLDTAWVYPGQCLLEGTNLSEGRGTTRPFELSGAPWIDGAVLCAKIERDERPGLALRPVVFEPMFQKHAGQRCGGVQLHVTEPRRVRSLLTTYALLAAIWQQSAGAMRWREEAYEFVADRLAIDLLAGGTWLRDAIESGARACDMVASQAEERERFLARRRAFLIYD